MAENDLAVRQELVKDGSLGKQGYHSRMEAVHQSNTTRLSDIIEQHGWPRKNLVGEDGANAAWLIAQHSIGNPPFMRKCLFLLQQAASHDEVHLWQPAMLEDRIRMYEGKLQIYGSQFEADENGQLVSYPIEDLEGVDDRRRTVGMNTLQERMTELRNQADQEKIQIPSEWREEYEKWLRTVGWRK